MAQATDRLVDLHVNREGILRQDQRARNKIAVAKTTSAAAARNKLLDEADAEIADGMTELKDAKPVGSPDPGPGPEPPPPPPPPTPTGKPLRAWGKITDFREVWGHNSEVVHDGRAAFQMAVLGSDYSPPNNHQTRRAQLGSEGLLSPGQEGWFAGEFWLPPEFPSKVKGWGVNIVEDYIEGGSEGTSPPFQIQARSGRLQYRAVGSETDLYWDAPLSSYIGRWITWIKGGVWGGSSPKVELWVDGSKVVPMRDLNMGKFKDGKERIIIQCYYEAVQDCTLWHGRNLRYGKTLADVR